MLNEISAFFHKGRNYDYHLIIKERANKFEGQLGCPEKTQKTKKTKFIGIAKFMVSSLWNPIGNLIDGIHETKSKVCDCFLKYESFKDNLIKYKQLWYHKDYSNETDDKIKKQFKNTLKFLIKRLVFLIMMIINSFCH